MARFIQPRLGFEKFCVSSLFKARYNKHKFVMKYIKRFIWVLLPIIFISTLAVPFLSIINVRAADTTASWIDRNHIRVNGTNKLGKEKSVTFFIGGSELSSARDPNMGKRYGYSFKDSGCNEGNRSYLHVTLNKPGTGDLLLRLSSTSPPPDNRTTCDDVYSDQHSAKSISISNTDNSKINFKYDGINRLVGTDQDPANVFVYNSSTKNYLWQHENGKNCQDYIEIGASKTSGNYVIRDENGGGCKTSSEHTVNTTQPPEGSPDDDGVDDGGGSGTGEDEKPTCESEGGEMSWILCPVLRGLDAAIRWIDDRINELLTVGAEKEDGKGYMQHPGIKKTWSNLRNIAYLILVPIMLIMVIGTAAGFEFLSAYTVKRALPRLVAAVIFITLSFELTKFMMTLTDTVGQGLQGLILSPFGGGEISLRSIFGPEGQDSALFAGAVILGSAGAATFGSIGVILSFALTAALTLFIGLLLLALRQVLLVALAIVAPIAILAWIFPGNDRGWKLWWGSFSKLLLLFPLIAILIASGKAFASVVHDVNSGTLDTILKLTAYVGPYFFIPATFKFAGGAFANIAGIANDRGRGIFDRLKKGRQQQYGKNWEDAKAGNRWKGQNVLSRRASKALQTATLIPSGGLTTNVKKRRERMATARSSRNFDNATKFLNENASAQAIKNDDDKLWAAMEGDTEEQVRASLMARAPQRFADKAVLGNAVAEVMRFKREAGDETGRIAATIAQAGTGTGFNYRHDGINDDMFTAILAAAGDDRGLSGRMLGAMRPMTMQSGRVDLGGGGFAKSAMIMDKRRAAIAGGPAYSEDDARLELMQDVLQSNAGAAVAGKVEAVHQLAPVMKANVDAAFQSGDTVQAARELAKIAGKYDAAAQIAPQNAEALADGILAQGINLNTQPQAVRDMIMSGLRTNNPQLAQAIDLGSQSGITYQQAVEALRGNADFQTMRREYQSAGVAQAQQQMQQQLTGQQGVQQQPVIPPVKGP